MEIQQAIRERRTIKNFKPDGVPMDAIRRIVEAGTWAQNHGMTQPWRFRVIGPETRETLASANESVRPKLMVPPVLICVSQMLASDPSVRREDYAATACAVQNMGLAAWSEGLGMIWSTGRHTRDTSVAPILRINPETEEIIGFVAFGVPEIIPPPPPRKALGEVLTFLP